MTEPVERRRVAVRGCGMRSDWDDAEIMYWRDLALYGDERSTEDTEEAS